MLLTLAVMISLALHPVTLIHLLSLLGVAGMATGVFTHSITKGYKTDEGTVTSVVTSITGDAEAGVEATLAVGATNQLFTVAITRSQILSICLFASTSMTVKTNSSSTPQDTISIAAGGQVVYEGAGASGAVNPFSGNITALYVTNNDPKAGNFKLRVLLNQ